MDADRLAELDAEGYTALLAIAYGRGPKHSSFAYPHAFVCEDGATYWVKRFQHSSFYAGESPPQPGAQQGLIAELAAGRLGSATGAAASAAVVDVPSVVLRRDGTTAHLEGIGVGVSDQTGMENLRYLAGQMPGGRLDAAKLDEASVARVVAFQSWIGADDTQVMVDLRNGRMLSIDHGAYSAFSSSDPAPVVAPGIPAGIATNSTVMEPEIGRIEAVTDEEILLAVARVPDASEWRAERDRRVKLAESLALRRDRLRQAMAQWMT